jgi:hypothetical protein
MSYKWFYLQKENEWKAALCFSLRIVVVFKGRKLWQKKGLANKLTNPFSVS